MQIFFHGHHMSKVSIETSQILIYGTIEFLQTLIFVKRIIIITRIPFCLNARIMFECKDYQYAFSFPFQMTNMNFPFISQYSRQSYTCSLQNTIKKALVYMISFQFAKLQILINHLLQNIQYTRKRHKLLNFLQKTVECSIRTPFKNIRPNRPCITLGKELIIETMYTSFQKTMIINGTMMHKVQIYQYTL